MPRSRSHVVATPVVPSVAMKRNASGTPPKLAKTPEEVDTMRRRFVLFDVWIAYARSRPMIPGTTDEMTASSRLVS